MRMDEMLEILENAGFSANKRYNSVRREYTFTIKKNDIFYEGIFIYPDITDYREIDRRQRNFLTNLMHDYEKYAEYVRNDVSMTRNLLDKQLNVLRKIPDIKKVIFNPPAQDEDFDPEKGLAMAISKKALGNQGNYCNEIKKWVDKWASECEYMRIHKKKRVLFKDLGTPTEFTFTIAPDSINVEQLRTLGDPVDTFNVSAIVDEIRRWDEELKPNPVQKAYDILVAFRDKDTCYDLDEVIGYLGEALDE